MATMRKCILTILFYVISIANKQMEAITVYEMSVSLKQNPLPISMSWVSFSSVKSIRLKMGHQSSLSHSSPYPRGITAYIENTTSLTDAQLSQIKSLLMISQDSQYQIYLPQQQILLISNPNDRFCSQHLQYFLRYFYPCRNYAYLGLDRLINPTKLLQKFLAIELVWLVDEDAMNFQIMFPMKTFVNETIKKQTKCGIISIYSIRKDLQIEQLDAIFFEDKIEYSGKMVNRWYHPYKCISHSFYNQENQSNSTITLVNMLPYGFVYEGFYSNLLDYQINLTQHKIGTSLFLIFRFELGNHSQSIINVKFRAGLPTFETFQTVAGGGQEIMSVPLLVHDNILYQLHSNIISQRLLEPDFSIPFQTITFTVGIIGYLWINLWRIHKFYRPKEPLKKVD